MEDLRVAKAFLAKVSAYGRQRALEHQAVSENASDTIQAAAASAFDLPTTMRTVKLQVSMLYTYCLRSIHRPLSLILGCNRNQCWTTCL